MRMCRCGKLISYNGKFCNECAKKYEKEKQENNKYYDKYIRKNKEVYKDKRWTKLTDQCKQRFKGLDIYSYFILGKLEYGNISHHIETVKDCEARRYDIDNLIYLSNVNHGYIHRQYDRSEKDKKNMQELLFHLIKIWEDEFGH
ncbi:HNH endonuclease [Wukongibacter sp. M2B1]|uniref:HNH endonuclease n=1 Tax=Wukongibacter sp. M2B1 TaxID=3088895 RepID=UPI003D7B941C